MIVRFRPTIWRCRICGLVSKIRGELCEPVETQAAKKGDR